MLLESLRLVEQSLNTYLFQRLGAVAGVVEVALGNVAAIEQPGANLDDKLIISLVNIEEERSLKNARSVRANGLTGALEYRNPPVSLNLYLLFSAHFTNNYDKALRVLSLVIEFFQGQTTFRTPAPGAPGALAEGRAELTFNLYTMTFEQLNHLWGALGGKQLPSALYRVYLVQLEDGAIREGGRLIEEITAQETVS
ncbi:hypothetical protein GGR26_002588 [Lewinella marina]|uniref:Pvc16 N-terminal domain-containing protein n=1 Tax=Neolewinella marina TaxID=438751 RepID=A0A2G0CB10_9BACT|nr:DUF4255 domain-containing protein [Neolewinella marina]NJB86811.1 hypothetical protein [Neolewinella marina]PHK97179.1 hypothetical protein CGL56_17205 [Neolewinella marina]